MTIGLIRLLLGLLSSLMAIGESCFNLFFFVFSLRNIWKTRNTGMRKTWLKSWKASKVSSSVFCPSFGELERVCPVGPSLLVDLVSACLLAVRGRRCTGSVFCFLCGKEGLLQFQSGFQGRIRSGPGGMWRGIFPFVVSRKFGNLGGKRR